MHVLYFAERTAVEVLIAWMALVRRNGWAMMTPRCLTLTQIRWSVVRCGMNYWYFLYLFTDCHFLFALLESCSLKEYLWSSFLYVESCSHMLFLFPKQQCQSTEGKCNNTSTHLASSFTTEHGPAGTREVSAYPGSFLILMNEMSWWLMMCQ